LYLRAVEYTDTGKGRVARHPRLWTAGDTGFSAAPAAIKRGPLPIETNLSDGGL